MKTLNAVCMLLCTTLLTAQAQYIGFVSTLGTSTNYGPNTVLAEYQTTPGSVNFLLQMEIYIDYRDIDGTPIPITAAPRIQFVASDGTILLERDGWLNAYGPEFPNSYMFGLNSYLDNVAKIRLVQSIGAESSFGDTVTVKFKKAVSIYNDISRHIAWTFDVYPNLTNTFVSSSPIPRLKFTSIKTEGASIRVQCAPHAPYSVEMSDNLAGWATLTNFVSTNNIVIIHDEARNKCFYRAYLGN